MNEPPHPARHGPYVALLKIPANQLDYKTAPLNQITQKKRARKMLFQAGMVAAEELDMQA